MNWGELKAAVVAYTHRTDAEALLPAWLKLAEQRIYFGEQNTRPLRVSGMLKAVDLATPATPADFIEAKLLHAAGDERRALDYRPLSAVASASRSFSWSGGEIVLSPDQALPLRLIYYRRFATLAIDSDTNWLLSNAPNVYLASMLVEVARWSRDDALGAREAANFASATAALQAADDRAQHSGSLLTMRMKGAAR